MKRTALLMLLLASCSAEETSRGSGNLPSDPSMDAAVGTDGSVVGIEAGDLGSPEAAVAVVASADGGDEADSGSELAAQAFAQCIAVFEAGGLRAGDCELCLCRSDRCQAESLGISGDALAEAVTTCGRVNGCGGDCCLCNAVCSSAGLNYGRGPCSSLIEMAAGVTPGAGVAINGAAVEAACGTPTNSCGKASRLADCRAAQCAADCGIEVCM